MNKLKIVDCMLDADKRLQEGYGELKATGKSYYCEDLVQFMPVTVTPTILNLFELIKNSDKSSTVKVFALEGLASGLSEVAMMLGFIGIKESNNEPNNNE